VRTDVSGSPFGRRRSGGIERNACGAHGNGTGGWPIGKARARGGIAARGKRLGTPLSSCEVDARAREPAHNSSHRESETSIQSQSSGCFGGDQTEEKGTARQ